MRAALAARDGDAVAAWNDGARDERRRLLEADLAGGEVHELRVAVPNRPGVVAEVALALGRAGVNILDMALYPAPDMSTGTIALWIAGERHAVRGAGARRRPRADGGAAMNVRFSPDGPLRGSLAVPPDKSLSHRAALFAAMTDEPVVDHRLPRRGRHELDARRGAGAGRAGGARAPARWSSAASACAAAAPAAGAIDVGNAGTLMRLLPGWLAGQEGGSWTLDGDASIRRRPVDRVATPLAQMGARIDGDRRPLPAVHDHRQPAARDRVRAAGRVARR